MDRQDRDQPRGKQADTGIPKSCDYYCTTGIWQRVWLEPVPPRRIEAVEIVPRLGLEYVLRPRAGVEMDLRAGYAFEPSPAPRQVHAENILDEARSIVSVGYGIAIAEPLMTGLHVDFFGQLQVLHGRDHEKGPGVPADNPGAPDLVTSGKVLAFGTQAGVAF